MWFITDAQLAQTSMLNLIGGSKWRMASDLEHHCPDCDEEQTFYRAASTTLHLGEKTKWYCPECGFGFVTINGIDSTETNVA